jgi:hypothetical protein
MQTAAPAANPGTPAAGVAFNQGAGSQPAASPAAEPSLASQYVSANQETGLAEEEDDNGDDLLKSIIRLIKQ